MNKIFYRAIFIFCVVIVPGLSADSLIIKKDDARNEVLVQNAFSGDSSESIFLGALTGTVCAFADTYSPAPFFIHWSLESRARDSFFNRSIAVQAHNGHIVVLENVDGHATLEHAMYTLFSQDNKGKTVAWLSSWIAYLACLSYLSGR